MKIYSVWYIRQPDGAGFFARKIKALTRKILVTE